MTHLQTRIEIEKILRDHARKRRMPCPELHDEEIDRFCAEGKPDRDAVFRFVVAKLHEARKSA